MALAHTKLDRAEHQVARGVPKKPSALEVRLFGCSTPHARRRELRKPVGLYNVDLVAIDWYPNGDCYCQNDCACMLDVGGDATTITRDSAVDALPSAC